MKGPRKRRSLRFPGVCEFLSSVVVCGRKAPKSICQQASPGFLRLRSGQALRLRAIKLPVCDRSAKRFAQDDGFVRGLEIQLVGYAENTKGSKMSHALLSCRHPLHNDKGRRQLEDMARSTTSSIPQTPFAGWGAEDALRRLRTRRCGASPGFRWPCRHCPRGCSPACS
jgi:hypothetical protein